MVALQNTSIKQVFYDASRDPYTIFPRFLFLSGSASSTFPAIPNVLELLQGCKHLVVVRDFALGDILMTIPIVRSLRHRLQIEKVSFCTQRQEFLNDVAFRRLAEGVYDEFLTPPQLAGLPYSFGLYLNGVLERDHYDKSYHTKHRLQILLDFVGLEAPLTWGEYRLPKVKKQVALQRGGSSRRKRLPPETYDSIADALRNDGFTVVEFGPNMLPLPGAELLDLVASSECLVTMDSSPLWFSHFTDTSVVVLLGPTRVEERLTFHPGYPNRTIGVALNELVGCESCFEQAYRCNNKLQCMHADKDAVTQRVLQGVRSLCA